ncbi:MAG: polyprenyl synthetase family protein [Candidatus Bathyarchaeia archaeon]
MRKTKKKLMERVQMILEKRGQKSFEIAKNAILQEKAISEPVYEALRYFMEESWYDVQHPALLSLACEAVGGDPEATTPVGAAIVLLAGAADIHDDIIDKSEIKESKPTVLRKFGEDIALLAGDALLFKGLIFLDDACAKFPAEKRMAILDLTRKAFFEISGAEAKEATLKGKRDLKPEEYRKVIEMKAAVAEAMARIGAIIGGGESEEIDALGHYGRTLGILMTIRDDFVDLFELDELRNRIKNECLPLPLLYALQNNEKKSDIIQILEKNEITKREIEKILDLVMDAKKVLALKEEMMLLTKEEEKLVNLTAKNRSVLKLMLRSTLEDL